MTRLETLQAAVDLWGVEAQIMMAIEEMAELTQALSKVYRKGWTNLRAVDQVCEELADVRIMLDQLEVIVARGPGSGTKDWEAEKLARLEGLVRRAIEAKAALYSEGATR